MKKIITAMLASMMPIFGNAQETVCLGINCTPMDAPDVSGFMPGQVGGFSNWNDYATWAGLTTGLHIPDDVPIKQCFKHCATHALDAKKACLDVIGTGGSVVCDGVFNAHYLGCTKQCDDNPHGDPSIF